MRKWRDSNKLKASYTNLKSNAKRRGKEFTLTIEEFEKFCIETNYLVGKGRTKKSLHVDRINEKGGYTIDNIQTLENHVNVSKYLMCKFDGYQLNCKTKIIKHGKFITEGRPDNECPF